MTEFLMVIGTMKRYAKGDVIIEAMVAYGGPLCPIIMLSNAGCGNSGMIAGE
jgi:hypothetical protein